MAAPGINILNLRLQLSPRPKEPISEGELARLLNVSRQTVTRWGAGLGISPRNQERIERILELLKFSENIVPREERIEFLKTSKITILNYRYRSPRMRTPILSR